MKSLTLMNLVLPLSLTALYTFSNQSVKPVNVPKKKTVTIVEENPNSIELLIEAMIQVESRGDSLAVGDRHLEVPSVGVLQIRPIMVKEVNRILKKYSEPAKYTLEDRYSREKSIEMFRIWKAWHHSQSTFEKIARCWNGGPNGHKNPATLSYWNKVQAYL